MARLISYNKYTLEFSGDKDIMYHLENASSKCGILNFELFFKTYREYEKNRSIYDLSHNRPILLMAKSLKLIDQCQKKTIPTSLKDITEIGSCLGFNKPDHLFPQFPTEYLEYFKDMFDHTLVFRKDLSEEDKKVIEESKAKIYRHWKLSFYKEWPETNIFNLSDWIASCIHNIYDFHRYIGTEADQYLPIIKETMANRVKSKINWPEVKEMPIKVGMFRLMLHSLGIKKIIY